LSFIVLTLTLPHSPAQAEAIKNQAVSLLDSASAVVKKVIDSRIKHRQDFASQENEDPFIREAQIVKLRLCPRRLVLHEGEEFALGPLALDNQGEPVNGAVFAWEASDPSIAEVASDGTVLAVGEGRCLITVSAGRKRARVLVEVRKGERRLITNTQWDAEHSGDCNDPEDESDVPVVDEPSVRNDHQTPHGIITPSVVQDPDDQPNKPDSAKPFNATGHPRFTPNEMAQASSAGTDSQLGSSNFSLDIPIFDSPGRGVGIDLSLIYNSRQWTKNGNEIVFNYDQGWPAPGFRLNYGRIIPNYDAISGFPGNYLLIEDDGTRIPLIEQPDGITYISEDGQYIQFDRLTNKLHYTDGTEVLYAFNNNKLLPNSIMDIHGNSITISYVTSCADAQRVQACACGSTCQKPQRQAINTITDTLGRQVVFYYYADGNLAEIRVPGYNSASPRTIAKFYYQALSLSYNFGSMTVQNVPSGNQIDALRRVYFPDTGRGYVFDSYSAYGMCGKISMRLGMTDAFEGTEVSYTEYIHQTSGTLSDAPRFTERREWWQGKTDDFGNEVGPTSYASYTYGRTIDNVANTVTNTVTMPDGTQTQMISSNSSSSVQFGLLKTIKVIKSGVTVFQQDYSYSSAPSQGGLQRTSMETMPDNVTANKTRVDLTYANYGRLSEVVEYGFAVSGTFKKRRRTSYAYFDGGVSYTDKGLLRMVESIRVYDAKLTAVDTDDTIISRTRYIYDCIDCPNPDPNWGLVTYGFTTNCSPSTNPPCTPPPGYKTKFVQRTERGQITKVEFFSDATSTTPDITFRHQYDIFGNEVKAELSCCSLRQSSFNSTMYWSEPVSTSDGGTSGPQLTTNCVYDFNTSFLKTKTDPNGLITSYAPDSAMRLRTTTFPKLSSDANPNPTLETFFPPDPNYSNKDGLLYQTKFTYFDGSTQRVEISNAWFDGAGNTVRIGSAAGPAVTNYDAVKTIYDDMGRTRKITNPYNTTASDGNITGLPNPTTYDYDGAGRVTRKTLPDGNFLDTIYNGAVVTMTDEAGRQKRSEIDGLGRLIKVTEMDDAKALNWVTNYGYDLNDNMILVDQGGQTRAFKYDSLSRMTFEKTPEQAATINDGTGTLWSAKYTYTSFGAISTREDARRVVATYSYDTLNRLTGTGYQLPNPNPDNVLPTNNVTITYGTAVPEKGQVKTITDSAGTETFSYDGLSRVQSRTRTLDGQNYTVGYQYNQAGQMKRLTYPSNRRVDVGYDARGRLNTLTGADAGGNPRSYINSLTYWPSQQINNVGLANGVTENYQYSTQRLQLSSQTITKGGSPLMSISYNYAASMASGGGTKSGNTGQLIGITAAINAQTRNQDFSYDQVGRLKTATGSDTTGSWQRRYGYDRWGNRTGVWNATSGGTQLQNVVMQTSGSAPTNRISTVNLTGYSYDANGNLKGDGSNTYNYDAENRMVSSSGALGASYLYDSSNRRV
jgi:YD repeat-containing protein